MGADLSPQGAVIRHYQQPADVTGVPGKTLLGDGRRETDLLVNLSERLLDCRDVGLQLDYQERLCGWQKRQHVDRPALAVNVVGNLDSSLPAGSIEDFRDSCRERRMIRVEQAVELAGPPAHLEHEAGIQRGQDLAQDGYGGEMTALGVRDCCLGTARGVAELDLTPASATAQNTHDATHALVVHQSSMMSPTYQALSGQGTRMRT